MHFKVCLDLYPLKCGEFDSTFTVGNCLLTSAPQVVVKDTVNPLISQHYDLSSTVGFTYELGLLQLTPRCYISSATSWTLSQGPVILGSNAADFLSIDPNTGVYSIAAGQDPNNWGTYTVQISSVTFQGTTYTGA